MAAPPGMDKGIAALVYDYLKNTAGGLAETFKTKVNPVRVILV